MSEKQVFLEEVHIKNFLSLRDVPLLLKPLTVLVGPNASGKSNVLSALNLFNKMIVAEKLPPVEFIQDHLWAGMQVTSLSNCKQRWTRPQLCIT